MKTPAKHTPGPWCFGVGVPSSGQCSINSLKTGFPVARIPFSDAEGKADAALIAAAPDLLEALHGLLHVQEDIGGPERDKAEAAARAAIAKATGGAQ